MEALVEQSLVERADGDGAPRFRMLEVVREYALEQLEPASAVDALRARHARYFLGLAERSEPLLRGSEQVDWLARLEADHDNVRAAMAWGLAQPAPDETALRLAGSLAWFWFSRAHVAEARRWLALSLARSAGSPGARLKAQFGIGMLAHYQRDAPEARHPLGIA